MQFGLASCRVIDSLKACLARFPPCHYGTWNLLRLVDGTFGAVPHCFGGLCHDVSLGLGATCSVWVALLQSCESRPACVRGLTTRLLRAPIDLPHQRRCPLRDLVLERSSASQLLDIPRLSRHQVCGRLKRLWPEIASLAGPLSSTPTCLRQRSMRRGRDFEPSGPNSGPVRIDRFHEIFTPQSVRCRSRLPLGARIMQRPRAQQSET